MEGTKDLFADVSDNLKGLSTKKNLLTIIKYSFVVIVCLLVFVFSFLGVVNVDISQVASSYIGIVISEDVNIENAEVDLYSIDIIRMMFATLKYNDEQVGKFEKRVNNSYSKYLKELSKLDVSYSSNTVKFSNKAKHALHDFVIDSYVLTISQFDIEDMDGSSVSSIWTVGCISLINILATAVMFGFSIYELVKVIKKIRKGEEVKLINKLDAFLPLLIALPLAAILSFYPLGKYVSVAGSLVAGMVFASIASLIAIVCRLGKEMKEKGTIKSLIPNCFMVVLCIVIIGCCFAPIYNAEVTNNNCDTDLYSDAFIDSLLTEEELATIEERLNRGYYDPSGKFVQGTRYDALTTLVETSIKDLVNQTAFTLYAFDSEVLYSSSLEIITRSCYVQLGLIGAPMMAAGYFALVISIIFAFGCLSAIISGNKKSKLALTITLLVMLLIVLAFTITQYAAVTHQLSEMKTEAFKLSLKGGTIVNVILAIGLLVLTCLSTKFKNVELVAAQEDSSDVDNNVTAEDRELADDLDDSEIEVDDDDIFEGTNVNDSNDAVEIPLDEH